MKRMARKKERGLRPLLVIFTLYGATTLLTAVAARLAGSPFTLWFKDSPYILLGVFLFLGGLGVAWDTLLIGIGFAWKTWRHRQPADRTWIMMESVRKTCFFNCGPLPLLMIVMTAFVLLGTSNITLINLKLLATVTEWHDSFFWGIEGPLIEWLTHFPIDTAAWDRLYHSCWAIQLCAAFALIVIDRGSRIVLHFCVSLILLFYVGRFLGLLNPVMGPAFFRPELFTYLDGSFTGLMMQRLAAMLAMDPWQMLESGGVLLGGVSAMPSLHVSMVSVTAYWLSAAKRWTMYVTVPWVLLVWTSTVVLGWHYILDGAGGIALGTACIWATHWGLRVHGIGIPSALHTLNSPMTETALPDPRRRP